MNDASTAVVVWWASLSALAVFNLCLLVYARQLLRTKQSMLSAELFRLRSQQWNLAALYTVGCAFRSIVPRADVQRTVLFDSWISSVAIGRSVATVAELAFVAQWALLLREISRSTGDTTIGRLGTLIVPLIAVAEICSWYGVLTTNSLGNTIEESIWALSAAVAATGFVLARPYYEQSQRRFLHAGIAAGVAYIAYMVTIDVPAYWAKYRASEALGREYTSIRDGLYVVASDWTVSWSYASWEYEIVWMSLYFSLAVWMSLYIVNAPRMDAGIQRR